MILLGGFGRSARMRGWAVLDGLRSKELNKGFADIKRVLPISNSTEEIRDLGQKSRCGFN